MSKEDPNNLGHYHNQGQEDRAEGESPSLPNAMPDFLLHQYEIDQNDAYREGYEHTDDQKKDK